MRPRRCLLPLVAHLLHYVARHFCRVFGLALFHFFFFESKDEQPGFRAYRPQMSSTGDPTVSSGGLRISAYSASASGFRTAAILARLDLVSVEPHEAMEVGASLRVGVAAVERRRHGSLPGKLAPCAACG